MVLVNDGKISWQQTRAKQNQSNFLHFVLDRNLHVISFYAKNKRSAAPWDANFTFLCASVVFLVGEVACNVILCDASDPMFKTSDLGGGCTGENDPTSKIFPCSKTSSGANFHPSLSVRSPLATKFLC